MVAPLARLLILSQTQGTGVEAASYLCAAAERGSHRKQHAYSHSFGGIERLLLNHERHWDSWPPEEKNSIWSQRRGLITQSFCVIKFYYSIKETEKASDTDIRRGQKEYPLLVFSRMLYSY